MSGGSQSLSTLVFNRLDSNNEGSKALGKKVDTILTELTAVKRILDVISNGTGPVRLWGPSTTGSPQTDVGKK